jgi:hypothetical protein
MKTTTKTNVKKKKKRGKGNKTPKKEIIYIRPSNFFISKLKQPSFLTLRIDRIIVSHPRNTRDL